MQRAEHQKHLLDAVFSPIATLRKGIRRAQPWDSIIDFATHKSFCGKKLYPRQRTLLKLIKLETENFSDYDRAVIEEWTKGFVSHRPEGVQPDVLERVEHLKARGYTHFPHVELILGRRGSKGISGGVLGAERLAYFHSLGDWQAQYDMDPGADGYLTVVATNMTQAMRFQFNDIRRTVEKCRYLQPHISTSKEGFLSLRTSADIARIAEMKLANIPIEREIATLRAIAMSSNSASGRGAANFAMYYDEFAHMIQGTGGKQSSEEVYSAYQPSLDSFHEDSFTFVPSSPYTMIGQFFDLYLQGTALMPVYEKRHGLREVHEVSAKELGVTDVDEAIKTYSANPEMLVVQLPSWALYKDWEISHTMDVYNRPLRLGRKPGPLFRGAIQLPPEQSDRMRLLERSNPEKFKVERRAQFASVIDAYLDPIKVDAMFERPFVRQLQDDGELAKVIWRQPLVPQDYGRFDRVYLAHADPGRTNANFAFAIAHTEAAPADDHGEVWPHVIFDYLQVWKPADFEDHTIDYVLVGEELHDILNRFRSTEKLSFDQWNSAGFIAQLRQAYSPAIRIVEEPFSEKVNLKRAEMFKSAVNLGWVHSYRDNFYKGNEGSLLEMELKFLTEKNGKVIKQDFGPVTTKDLADCYSDDVEVLTEHGWKLISNVGNERVATRSDSGELEYQYPIDRIEKHYSGQLVIADSGSFNFAVTPTHRMLAVDYGSGKHQFLEAQDVVAGRTIAVPRRAVVGDRPPNVISFSDGLGQHRHDGTRTTRHRGWTADEDEYLTNSYGHASMPDMCAVLARGRSPIYNRARVLSLKRGQLGDRYRDGRPCLPDTKAIDFARFLGMWMADGAKMRNRPGNDVVITQTKPEGIDWIDAMFSRLGWPVRRSLRSNDETAWTVNSRQLKAWLMGCQSEGHELLIPDEVFSTWTREEMAALLEGLMVGDGVWHSQNGRHQKFSTTSRRLADDVQRLIAHLGEATARVRRQYEAGPALRGRHKANHDLWSVDLDHAVAARLRPDAVQFEDYDGMVYCLTVPNSTLLVRREGVMMWCGNCVMTVTTGLLHAQLDRYLAGRAGQMSFGSSDVQKLRSPAGVQGALVGSSGEMRGGVGTNRAKLAVQRNDKMRARSLGNQTNRQRGRSR